MPLLGSTLNEVGRLSFKPGIDSSGMANFQAVFVPTFHFMLLYCFLNASIDVTICCYRAEGLLTS